MDVQINLDRSVESEPRVRLQLAENLLRDAHSLIHSLEVQYMDCFHMYCVVFICTLTVFLSVIN